MSWSWRNPSVVPSSRELGESIFFASGLCRYLKMRKNTNALTAPRQDAAEYRSVSGEELTPPGNDFACGEAEEIAGREDRQVSSVSAEKHATGTRDAVPREAVRKFDLFCLFAACALPELVRLTGTQVSRHGYLSENLAEGPAHSGLLGSAHEPTVSESVSPVAG